MDNKKAVIIGAGIGGIATAIRLAKKGLEVEVFEKNKYPGGKLSVFEADGFRFDAGPSLFTMPELVEELISLQAEDANIDFPYLTLEEACKYFWEDGTELIAYTDNNKFAQEVENKLGVKKDIVLKYLKEAAFKYDKTAKVFLEKSLHKNSTYLSKDIIPALLGIYKMGLFESMHQLNDKKLKNKKLTQLFDRFATYNGSDPYKAPGILTSIANLELNKGTYYPKEGMFQITDRLLKTAESLGAKFTYNAGVEEIHVDGQKVNGVSVNGEFVAADIVVSNMDVYPTYKHLLKGFKQPEAILKQERSSSALIFYWGINRKFDNLGLHNIFFSENYQEEFEHIFDKKAVYSDPTVYVNITAKHTPTDAPDGLENWFVMVNVPANSGQDWDSMIPEIRRNTLKKLSKQLEVSIEELIVTEHVLEPRSIEARTSSHQGALYGTSSNNKYAAFFRHPNFHNKIDNLYFSGGSVHPGGGIPLCLLSAKIIDDLSPARKAHV